MTNMQNVKERQRILAVLHLCFGTRITDVGWKVEQSMSKRSAIVLPLLIHEIALRNRIASFYQCQSISRLSKIISHTSAAFGVFSYAREYRL